ncbi:3-hydroxyisobutyryl-CoA hydrolase-like protein 2, mitochondrial [Vitis vinifera]|uniref:3-hydroxyisobutyryl-CoA hydrolase n=1 Tax=Vitis vinifera TaxID=29760 RepID=A0A438IK33_VITVI|nr:3-hydroxyisobutyryl-CoA hydrolase-like protein 2, mitochondrial [Vitis vinifera]
MAVHVFATPETLIGFHTDAGASFHLSHLPGYWGEYLALMGEKLNEPEMIACGLATHYAPSAKLPLIEERLGKLVTDDPSVIEASLEQYGSLIYPDNSGVLQRSSTITLHSTGNFHSIFLFQFYGQYPLQYSLTYEWSLPDKKAGISRLHHRSSPVHCNTSHIGTTVFLVSRTTYYPVYIPSLQIELKIETLDKCFSRGTVEEIIDAFEKSINIQFNNTPCNRNPNRYEKADFKLLINALSMSIECLFKDFMDRFPMTFVRGSEHEWWKRTMHLRYQ